jgi:LPS-assembly protein
VPSYLSRLTTSKLLYSLLPTLLLGNVSPAIGAEQMATDAWDISADKVMRYEKPDSIVAQGNVVLVKKERQPLNPQKAESSVTSWSELLGEEPQKKEVTAKDVEEKREPVYATTVTIKADWIVYDVELKTIKAKGNLEIITADDTLKAHEGTLNLVNETGKFKDAVVVRSEDSLHLEGETIEKTGLDTYRIIDGWAITCKLDKGQTPPWSFASANTDVRQGGYAVLKHARFNIHDVPILYSPYMIVPVKDTRQSGFLLPEFSGSSQSGFGINLPFFLNISDSADATFFPEYYVNRGIMPGLEFRYVANAQSKGTFSASYLDDALSDPSETEYYEDTGFTHDNSDRYWIRGKADHNFGDWQSRLDIDIVSDQDYLYEFNDTSTGFKKNHEQYLKEFGRGFQNQSEQNRANTFAILNSWQGISLQANLLAINEANTNASDTNTPLWQLPYVFFSGALPILESDFTFDWDSSYVNYWREDGIGGQRVDINPTISTPIRISQYLETRAEAGIRDTLYLVQTYGEAEWTEDDNQNRFFPQFTIETATTWEKALWGSGDSNQTIHQFRPYLSYNYLLDVDQEDLPKWDSTDEIGPVNGITYGVDNFLMLSEQQLQGLQNLSTYLNWKLEQSYSFLSEDSDEPFGDIYSEFYWSPSARTSVAYKTYYNVYRNDFVRHVFSSLLSDPRGDEFSVDYSFRKDYQTFYQVDELTGLAEVAEMANRIEQINGTVLLRLLYGWSVSGEIEHSLSLDETNHAKGALIYTTPCWSVKFQTAYTPSDTTYMVLFNLANIGTPFGIDF